MAVGELDTESGIRLIETLHDALTISNIAAARFYPAMPWWRGQAKHTWKLVPKVFREGRNYYRRETCLTNYFMQQAPSRYPNCPSKDDFADWLILMRHYGLATRLLDWTQSILVAIYFVVNEKPNEKGSLWALNPTELNRSETGCYAVMGCNSRLPKLLFKKPFETHNQAVDKVIALEPNQIDARVLAQLSKFTLHGTPAALNQRKGAEKFLARLDIPADNKEPLMNELRWLGIDGSSLFPDLEHLATELNSRQYWLDLHGPQYEGGLQIE